MWQRSRPTLAVSASARETTRQGRKMPTGSSITPEALPKNPAHLLEHAIAVEAKLQKKGIGNSPGMVTLPLHFQKVLCALKKAGEEAKQKATEQKVKDNQAVRTIRTIQMPLELS